MVRAVISSGCDDANVQNAQGRTPLHEVAESGDTYLLKMMAKLKADANIYDKVCIGKGPYFHLFSNLLRILLL